MNKLSQLLSPITTDTFFNTYFRKLPLFIPEDKNFDDILSSDEVNDYFNRPALLYPYVRVVGNGHEVDLKQYQLVGEDGFHILNKDALFRLFGEGHTLVIQGAQYQFQHLQQFVAALENELKLEINANIYITPSTSKGFFPHFDLHEVLVLQINGIKSWNLYQELPVEAPLKNTIPDISREYFLQTEPQYRLKLQPGDVLYIPRGVVHEAFCEEDPSIHVTLGFNPTLKTDIMGQLLKRLENIPYFRETFSSLKSDFDPTATATEMAQRISAELQDMIKEMKPYEGGKVKYSDSADRFALLFGIDNLTEEDVSQLDVEVLPGNRQPEDPDTQLLLHLEAGKDLASYMTQENASLSCIKASLKSMLKKEQVRLVF